MSPFAQGLLCSRRSSPARCSCSPRFCRKLQSAKPAGPRFEVSFPKEMSAAPLDGHVLLLIANNNDKEPRFQISFMTAESQQVFGVDVDALAPGAPAVIDASTLGYPAESLNDVPAGDYWVQAVLNIYETFHLGNGRTLKLPPDKGEGQHWAVKPGNLYSKPVKMHLDPKSGLTVRISLTEKNAVGRRQSESGRLDCGMDRRQRRSRHRRQQVGQAHPHSERPAHQVLGTSDLSRRRRSCCPTDGTSIPTRTTRSSSSRTTFIAICPA